MNRGSGAGRSGWPSGWTCFNEAPIHESGKSMCIASRPSINRGFNEAPIHESGKCRSPLTLGGSVVGFNEAPIHESGKYSSLAGNATGRPSLQ